MRLFKRPIKFVDPFTRVNGIKGRPIYEDKPTFKRL